MALAARKLTTTKKSPKAVVVPPQKEVAAPASKAAKQPKVNPHVAAGIDVTHYEGTPVVNKGRPAMVMIRDYSKDLTPRLQRSLYDLRDTYGTKQFGVRGLDNGVMRDLVGAGLIELIGGQQTIKDGHPHMTDGATPLMGKLSASGLKYGKP